MEYSVKELATLSGISARTLRYYDSIGLLCPARKENGYRCYDSSHVDTLQQILLYREMGFPLDTIRQVIKDPDNTPLQALEQQLSALQSERDRLDQLIQNVTRTILSAKGEVFMSDKEKLQGFGKRLAEANEKAYGKELRSKYGNEMIDASNKKLESLTKEKYADITALEEEIKRLLAEAVMVGDAGCEAAQRACALHREWLCHHWPDGLYNAQIHRNMAEMYLADERFKSYYEAIASGCTQLLHDAIYLYTEKEI